MDDLSNFSYYQIDSSRFRVTRLKRRGMKYISSSPVPRSRVIALRYLRRSTKRLEITGRALEGNFHEMGTVGNFIARSGEIL